MAIDACYTAEPTQLRHNERTMNTIADTDTLLAAVNEHHSTGDRAVLARALRRHESRKRECAKPESFAATLRRGFMSFNPWSIIERGDQ